VEIARGSRHTIEMNAKPAVALEPDHEEILEWIEAFDEVIDQEGPGQGTRLLDALTRRARQIGCDVPFHLKSP
jgi:pyruvate dehydrogenase complex dehydrogenase (E1) component